MTPSNFTVKARAAGLLRRQCGAGAAETLRKLVDEPQARVIRTLGTRHLTPASLPNIGPLIANGFAKLINGKYTATAEGEEWLIKVEKLIKDNS